MVVKGCGADFGLPLICDPLAKHITFTTPVRMHTSQLWMPGCGLMPRLATVQQPRTSTSERGCSTASTRSRYSGTRTACLLHVGRHMHAGVG